MTSPSTGTSSGQDSGGSSSTSVCFVATHSYGEDVRGDHMIRVVSPQGVFAEAVGTPGAQLELRAPTDQQQQEVSSGGTSPVGTPGGQSGQQVPQAESASQSGNVGSAGSGSSDNAAGQSDQGTDSSGSGERQAASAAQGSALKLRPDDVTSLRAVVVFPDADSDDERDVTNAAEFKSSKPDVASINTTTGYKRGEIKAKAEGNSTVTARYSGLVAKRQVIVSGETATALRIESANGETSVKAGAVLPLRATATFDSGKQQAVNEDVTWKSSDEAIADVDSGGDVEGVKAGTATVTGSYKGKDGSDLTAELELTVTGNSTGDESGGDTGSGTDSGGQTGGSGSGSDSGSQQSSGGETTTGGGSGSSGGSTSGGSSSGGSGGSGGSSSGGSSGGSTSGGSS